MKKLLLLLLPLMILSCYEDDDTIPQPAASPACLEVVCETEEEFFGKAIMNGECWQVDYPLFLKSSGRISIYLDNVEPNGIQEGLILSFFHNTDLQDTIWLGVNSATHPVPNIANARYSYREDHSIAGLFNFPLNHELTHEDYLLIDYVNADTSILEGRFQVSFPNRNVNSFVNAPDSMRLGCGRFRMEKL